MLPVVERVRIGSRRSELARLQARLVGDKIKNLLHAQGKTVEIEYVFKEAPGDLDLVSPLWQMRQVGVFTSFLHKSLIEREVDIVVHSWKDLPIDKCPGTIVAGTLAREDSRDLLLVKRTALDESGSRPFNVLTSSPRRQYNLKQFLPHSLPIAGLDQDSIHFQDVRGNIQTRMKKLLESPDAHALVVAKAAVDRFLETTQLEFQTAKDAVRATLEQCRWAVMPLSVNPTAAAQGALALEVADDNADMLKLVDLLNDKTCFEASELERQTLKKHGGGCHQKIGCSVLSRPYGKIFSLRGLSPEGEQLDDFRVLGNEQPARDGDVRNFFCVGGKEGLSLFRRQDTTEAIPDLSHRPLFVAKAEALPQSWRKPSSLVWTAGVESWRKLAARGIWVNGCCDRLGEDDADFQVDLLHGEVPKWLKVTHVDAHNADSNTLETIGTYKLLPDTTSDFRVPEDVTHIFWASGSAFDHLTSKFPRLLNAVHGCGPGHTLTQLQKKIPADRIVISLSYEEFKHKCSSSDGL